MLASFAESTALAASDIYTSSRNALRDPLRTSTHKGYLPRYRPSRARDQSEILNSDNHLQ